MFPYMKILFFSCCFKNLSLSLTFDYFIIVCLIIGIALVKFNLFKLLYLYSIHGSGCSLLFPGWEVFRHYCFTYTFCPLLFLSFCNSHNVHSISFHCVACIW